MVFVTLFGGRPAIAQRLPPEAMRSTLIEHAKRAIPPLDRLMAETRTTIANRRGDLARAQPAFEAAKQALEAAIRRKDSVLAAYWRERAREFTAALYSSIVGMDRVSALLDSIATDPRFGFLGTELSDLVGTINPVLDALRAIEEAEQRGNGLAATRALMLNLTRDEGVADKLLEAVANRDADLLARLLGTSSVQIDQGMLSARAMLVVFRIGNLRQCFAVTPLCAGNVTYGIQ